MGLVNDFFLFFDDAFYTIFLGVFFLEGVVKVHFLFYLDIILFLDEVVCCVFLKDVKELWGLWEWDVA